MLKGYYYYKTEGKNRDKAKQNFLARFGGELFGEIPRKIIFKTCPRKQTEFANNN